MPKRIEVPEPERLSYNGVRNEVATFVADFHVHQSVPVDVEHIADVVLGLDVVPMAGLRAKWDIDGYLSADRSIIYLDQTMASGSILHRHRFTVAHELGHWYLHQDLYEAAERSGLESFVDYVNAIPEETWAWYEWQAYAFAGLLLVPRSPLAETCEQAKAHALSRGFRDLDTEVEAHRSYLAEWIAKRFQVSAEVILKRGAKDGLWPETRAAE